MAITTLADYYAAVKQRVYFFKAGGSNSTPNYMSSWNADTIPAKAASLSLGNTANGLVPDNTTLGAASIIPFTGVGYITEVEGATNSTSALPSFMLYDRLFHAGSYAFNDAVTLASQPSFVARVPNSDYSGLAAWLEIATTITGVLTVTITYTNEAGATGHSAVISGLNGVGPNLMYRFPLASGDKGVSKIESVTGSVATGGTFNIVIARQLVTQWTNGGGAQNGNPPMWLTETGMPIVYQDSCLACMGYNYQSSPIIFEGYVEIASN